MLLRVSRVVCADCCALGLGMSLVSVASAESDVVSVGEVDAVDDGVMVPAEGMEDAEPLEPGFNKNASDNSVGRGWHPTVDPQSRVILGEMRSDREGLPEGFTKEQADRAEVQEAAEQRLEAARVAGGVSVFAAPANCRTYWPSDRRVCGKIREKYDAMGGPQSFLARPKSDELGVPDGVGRRNEFVNGFIYWHPDAGAHPVTTHFSFVWARNGWEAGRMGYPTSDEYVLPDGVGRRQDFQRSHIYGSLAGRRRLRGGFMTSGSRPERSMDLWAILLRMRREHLMELVVLAGLRVE